MKFFGKPIKKVLFVCVENAGRSQMAEGFFNKNPPNGPIPAFLSERFPTEIRNTASGLVYNGGLIIGAWSPIIAISLLSTTKSFSPNLIPLALALNISIGGIILLIGSRLNPNTRNMNLN